MNTAATYSVRIPTEAEVPAMAKLLADVFQQGDAMSDFLFPDAKQRRLRQPGMFAAMIRYRHLPEKSAAVAVDATGRIVGAMIWKNSWTKQSLTDNVKEHLALLAAMRARVIQGMALDAATQAKTPGESYIRGMYLAVDHRWQRSGVGKALLSGLADKADEARVPLYAACQDDKVFYYIALGGKIIGRTTVGRQGPVINLVRREVNAPRPPL
jgi:GNAT superfamily N-acetyltransferase